MIGHLHMPDTPYQRSQNRIVSDNLNRWGKVRISLKGNLIQRCNNHGGNTHIERFVN